MTRRTRWPRLMIPRHIFPFGAASVPVVLAATVGCSRSGLELFEPAPVPSPTEPPIGLPLCLPVDETLVGEAPPPIPCADPPPVSTDVQQLADQGGSLTLASDQCRKWAVGSVNSGDVRIAWSVDGAQTFGEALALGPGHRPFVVMDGMGAAHAFFSDGLTLAHVALDSPDAAPSSELLSESGKPAIASAEPVVHRAAAARGADEIAVTWDTRTEPIGVWFASTRPSGTFSEPIRVDSGTGTWATPRICLAGRDRVVIVWRTPGHDQQVLSAISHDGGASFCVATLGHAYQGDGVGDSVDVACTPDGRAVATWSSEDGVRVAALSRAGIWSPGDTIVSDAPYYPHIWIAGDRALVTWIGWGQTFGYALVDLSGTLSGSPVWAPDLNLDGKPDRFMRACARDDGFVLLTQGRFSYGVPQATGPAVMTFLDLSGTPALGEVIAPYGTTGVDVALECQPTGAVAIWVDAGAVTLARWAK